MQAVLKNLDRSANINRSAKLKRKHFIILHMRLVISRYNQSNWLFFRLDWLSSTLVVKFRFLWSDIFWTLIILYGLNSINQLDMTISLNDKTKSKLKIKNWKFNKKFFEKPKVNANWKSDVYTSRLKFVVCEFKML